MTQREAGREPGRRERRPSARLLAFLIALPLAPWPSSAAETALAPEPRPSPLALDPAEEVRLFAMPRITEEIRIALGRLQSGDLAGATESIEAVLARHPDLGLVHANRAALAMLAGEHETALDALETALRLGLNEPEAVLGDPIFAPIAHEIDARQLEVRASDAPAPSTEPVPAQARNGIAEVSGVNTRWNAATERLEPRFVLAEDPISAEVAPARPRDAANELLRDHWSRGRAAGNHGDFYDNRDRNHSALDLAGFPQLTRVTYSEAARAEDVDYGLNDRLLFQGIAFGNSSTALTGGPHWRSLPRLALTRPDGTGPMRLWQNWAANHLYVYPAHRDYGTERGDLFPANTPYLIISEGSSGSDQPFLEAVATILASFRPETKARLVEENLVVPTVQMVFRRSLQPIRSREAYFSGAAHPAAFRRQDINLARMISLANAIAPDEIPAEARIRVVEEDLGREGIDYFGAGLSEVLFDTPSAVARIWRSTAGRRSMLVSAEASRDPNDRPLTFHWRLLQGDPARVRIEPEADGSRARITIDWHEPFRISDANRQTSARVDIGVFANNGVHDSAPAILSWYFPPQEARRYEAGPDGAPRIVAIDHADPERADIYADPLLLPRADWRDSHHYDASGRLTGWTREREGRTDRFDPEGRRLLGGGSEAEAAPVVYPLAARPDGTLRIEEIDAP